MSVGRILGLCMTIIGALASLLAARTVATAWGIYETSGYGIASTRSMAAALQTVERLGLERSAAQPLLAAENAADTAALKPLLDARAARDEIIATPIQASASLGGTPHGTGQAADTPP